ncbi:UNVERIFIED_CONTAM: hypothetical protein GTU68_058861 [Idotea baltica]|nr:hypothetical protein [Idotea baltica]
MYSVEKDFHGKKLSFESGVVAKQTSGAVLVKSGDSVVLVTACLGDERDYNFLPLTIDYVEKRYASGKIPGGFFKREARLGEKETLTSRLIDRPCRPLFPKGFCREIQIIATVLSADPKADTDVMALCGASAALSISDIPFDGPIAGLRVCRIKGELVINPAIADQEKADINFILAGTKDAIVMVEGGAKEASEEDVLEALFFAHQEIQHIITMQEDLVSQCGKEKLVFVPKESNQKLISEVQDFSKDSIISALKVKDKIERYKTIKAAKDVAKEKFLTDDCENQDNPYTIRIVSEITESNGSSSMATVCGGSLALMDAGIDIKAPVAGVAMGMLKNETDHVILTDILGDEDHLGDMDFKVCGTDDGITALQMDIKIKGLKKEIMVEALAQAKEARLHILSEMKKVISEARTEKSAYAPGIVTFKISPNKIRDLIGSGGKTIKSIAEIHKVKINVDDNGTVVVAGSDQEKLKAAVELAKSLTAEAEVGKLYEGVVKRITDFGAFVEVLPGTDGLLHISQISEERVENVTDVLSEGDQIKVKVIDVDRFGKIKLSLKDLQVQ